MIGTEQARLDARREVAIPHAERSGRGRGRDLLGKLGWYRARLAAMSPDEIVHRSVEQAKRIASAWYLPDFASISGLGPLPVMPGLAEGIEALRDRAELHAQWQALAARTAAGRFNRLGVEWPEHDRAARWHLDPITGKSWPADRYCFDIGYRHSAELGDIKYVWEANRLQHLQPMAALAAMTGDRALADECAAEIASWIRHNPPFQGVNWISGIELALRAISIIIVTSLLPDEVFPTELRRRIRDTLAAHGYWLMRFPSRFSSANNHLIAEAAGLYLIGRLVPDLPDGDAWARHGRTVLIEECRNQIHPDGVGAEQSPTYTAFILELLMLAGCVGDRTGQMFPAAYWTRIEAAGRCLRWFTDAAGGQPRIGDDDEGRVIASRTDADPYVSSVIAGIAALRGRPDIAPPGVVPDLRHLLFGLPERTDESPVGMRHFADGGYTVFRTGREEGEAMLVFDHGPLGYLSIAAHGHADTLAVWLHIGGQPVLVDAGTYLYHSGGDHRSRLRGTRAHNTLAVAGTDSSRISGPFNWSSKANATVLDRRMGADGALVEAEHDGYEESHGVRHRRRIEQAGRTITILDRLVGATGPLPVGVGFLVHPDLTVREDGDGWIIAGPAGPLARIDGGAPLAGRVESGWGPEGGRYSAAFGQLRPAPMLSFEGALDAADACRFTITVLATDADAAMDDADAATVGSGVAP